MSIFGNGSAGNKHISVDTTFDGSEFNLQYTNFTIDAGVTLTLPSGAILRCLDTFTNHGTLIVTTAAAGGQYGNRSSSTIDGGSRPAHPGVSAGAAGTGSVDPGTVFQGSGYAVGGNGGVGLQGLRLASCSGRALTGVAEVLRAIKAMGQPVGALSLSSLGPGL
ncbi:MAG: hypothetical protein JOZ33_08880 [Acidobacteriaceae bacterium]|nr:hypothetical protein [Acidobacteriaceae bacterium]